MADKQQSLIERIKAHWTYAIMAVVVVSAGITFSVVDLLIARPLRDEVERLRSEIVRIPPHLRQMPGSLTKEVQPFADKTYEWQWAGENWYGRISLANQNNKNVVTFLRVGELHKQYADRGDTFGFQIASPILELVEGHFQIDANRLILDLIVDKKVIHSNVPARQRITGSLEQKRCFAGKAQYSDFAARTSYHGDMILVDYISHLDERIENWFASQRMR